MKYLKEFSNWNPALNKEVLDFIDTNKDYLIGNFFDKDKSDEENMSDLIDYYTKYPEEMKTELNIKNIKKPVRVDTIKNMTPKLINIGVNGFKSIDRTKIK